jgi:hypothetical protein
MNGFYALADALQHVRCEIVILEVVKSAFDNLAEIKGFGTARPGSKEIEALLGFRRKSYGSGHNAILRIRVFTISHSVIGARWEFLIFAKRANRKVSSFGI